MESTKVDDGQPQQTQRDSFNQLPGELVMKYVHNNAYNTKTWGLEFAVKKITPGVHTPSPNDNAGKVMFEAATPYRACVYQGETAEAAVGALLLGVGLLSRDGHMNPEHPTAKGVPPIQHAISVLSEKLVWHSERRREHLTNESTSGLDAPDDAAIQRIARDNEIISALATSIAALARVKDL